jgi:hypothetical protein
LARGDGCNDAFGGHDHSLAIWSEGGWRFLPPREGMRVFDREQRCFRLFADIWSGFEAPALPTGGSTIDVEARVHRRSGSKFARLRFAPLKSREQTPALIISAEHEGISAAVYEEAQRNSVVFSQHLASVPACMST